MTIEPTEPEPIEPEPTGSGPEGNSPVPAAIAATEDPVQLTVALVQDERVPEGMVCMGSYRNGRLVARSVGMVGGYRSTPGEGRVRRGAARGRGTGADR
jgi:L-asparaginase/Glu-tRNA(Gln) amidotransferase subunit D